MHGTTRWRTLFDQVQQHACVRPNHVAVWNCLPDGQYEGTSYRDLAAAARYFAQAFADQLSQAPFIPLCLGRSSSCIAAMLGAIGAGKTFICLHQKMRRRQVADILEAARASVALVDAAGLLTLRGEPAQTPAMTRVRWWLLHGPDFGALHEKIAAQLGEVTVVEPSQADMTATNVSAPLVLPPDPLRVGCCLFTSGSTGKPKGVLISERDLTARAWAEAKWYQLQASDVLLNILPFSFDVGLNQVLSALYAGCSLVLLHSWLPADVLEVVSKRRVTGISAVPSIWADFLKANLRFDTHGPHASLRYITISGGDLSRKQLDRLPAILDGVGIIKTYGQTETFRSAALLPPEFARKRQSVGRAFDNVRLYVVREDGTQAKAYEVGEIVHTGMGVMLGYLDGDDPQHKLRPNPFCGPEDAASYAVFTGDQGYLDEDGYFYVVGRRDEMLKVSGNRLYPREISDQLAAIDGVAEAEVVGVRRGDDDDICLVAFVVQKPGRSLPPVMLRRALALCLPSYMVPGQVVILPAMPRTANGKPDRQTLATRAAAILAHR